MRKNLAKHAAKKLPLAKRVLALCFALIFVCSCLLPAFANGAGTDFTDLTEDTSTVVEESVDTVEDTAPAEDLSVSEDLTADDGAATLDDGFGLATMDESFGVDDGVAALDDDYAVDDGVSTLDDDPISQPVGGIDLPIAVDPTPVVDGTDTPKEGAVNVTTDKDGNIVYEYDTSDVTFDDDFVVSQPDGDHALDKVDAAFAIPTNTYRFWLSEKDSYDLAEIASDAAAADLTEDEYLSLHGESKGLFHMMYVADGANLADYKFTSPTSVDDPSGNSRTFAGWYTIDDLGDKHDFKFDDYLYTSKSKTVDVYAKWEEDNTPVDVSNKVEVDDSGTTLTVKVKAMPKDTKSLSVNLLDDDAMESFYEVYVGSLSDESDAMMPLIGFNITPRDNSGSKIQPTETVTVTISDLSNIGLENGENLKVLHQAASGVETLDAEYSNGTLTFETKSFSNFVLAMSQEDSIATMEIAGEDMVKVGSTIQLTGSSNSRNCGYSQSWASNKRNIATVDSYGRVTGVAAGTATITHYYCANSEYHSYGHTVIGETYTVTVETESVDGTETPLYLYVLKPGREWSSSNTYVDNSNWFDLGIGTVKVNDMRTFTNVKGADAVQAAITNGTVDVENAFSGQFTHHYWATTTDVTWNSQGVKKNYTGKNLYPDLCPDHGAVDGPHTVNKVTCTKVYKYWDGKGAKSENYYEITWVHLLRSGGAPANTGYNEAPITGGSGGEWATIHLDGIVHFSHMYKVEFRVKEPGSSTFETLDPSVYSAEVEPGTNESKIVRPEQQKDSDKYDIEGTTAEHRGYRFEGWYTDEDCTQKAEFVDDINEDKIYYGKWVTNNSDVTLTKRVTGLFGDKNMEFNFTVTFAKDGNSEEQSVTLKNGDQITFAGVVAGTTITITETNADGYDTSATGYDVSETRSFTYTLERNSDGTFALKDENGVTVPNMNITVTNEKDAQVDNGVLLDTLPYLVILAVVVGGAVLLIARKHKHDDE